MKMVLLAFMVCFGFVACGEEIEPLKELQKGMPNTVTLSTGDVVYDISGEWDAIIEYGAHGGDQKDIVKINQDGNKFTGIITIGHLTYEKGEELLNGELEKNGFKSIQRASRYRGWVPNSGKIDESCKTIIIKAKLSDGTYYTTLTRK